MHTIHLCQRTELGWALNLPKTFIFKEHNFILCIAH